MTEASKRIWGGIELPAAPTFTAADLEAACRIGLAMAAGEAASEGWPTGRLLGVSEREEGSMDCANRIEANIRALTPPPDLADRVKGGEG